MVVLDRTPNRMDELARRKLRGIHLLHADASKFHLLSQRNAQAVQAAEHRVRALVENEKSGVLASLCRPCTEQTGKSRFPGSRGALDKSARAALQAAPEQFVQARQPAFQALAAGLLPVLGGNQAWIDLQSASPNCVVVEAAAEVTTSILGDTQPAAHAAEVRHSVFEQQRAMSNALHLQVMIGGSQVVEQQHRAAPAGKESFQCQDLAPVTQRVACK